MSHRFQVVIPQRVRAWMAVKAGDRIELIPERRGFLAGIDSSAWLEYFADGPRADAFATARRANAELWTQDADFEGLPGMHYFPKR